MKPTLLDLFCGAGGASVGYKRAGFYVIGVDIVDQPDYAGDRFIKADALAYLRDFPWNWARKFDAIHASPPCQTFTRAKHLRTAQGGETNGVYHVLADEVPKGGKTAETLEQAQQAMGIDWMKWDELKEAIPPAFTEYVGTHLMAALKEVAA